MPMKKGELKKGEMRVLLQEALPKAESFDKIYPIYERQREALSAENLRRDRAAHDLATFQAESERMGKHGYLVHGRAQHREHTNEFIKLMRVFGLPVLGGLLLFYFLIGPGLSAIIRLVGSLNIWLWIGGLLAVLWFWRSRT